MARKVTVVVETGKDLFSCFLAKDSEGLGFGLCGDGKTAQAAIEDFYVCRDEAIQDFKEQGKEFPDLYFHFVDRFFLLLTKSNDNERRGDDTYVYELKSEYDILRLSLSK